MKSDSYNELLDKIKSIGITQLSLDVLVFCVLIREFNSTFKKSSPPPSNNHIDLTSSSSSIIQVLQGAPKDTSHQAYSDNGKLEKNATKEITYLYYQELEESKAIKNKIDSKDAFDRIFNTIVTIHGLYGKFEF